MDRAYTDARTHGWSREPIVEMLIPSTLDDSLAPHGRACREPVLPARRAGAAGWRFLGRPQREVADLMIETVERYAPGFKASVIARQALSPLDLERHSASSAATSFTARCRSISCSAARPMLGYADYRGPLPGLYHCGAGAHPGGGVTGAPGHNAAQAILADRRWYRWRR